MSTEISSTTNAATTKSFSKKETRLIISISTVIAEIYKNLNSSKNSDLSTASPEKLLRIESWKESISELKEMLRCFPFIREGSVKTLRLRDNLESRTTTNDWVIDKDTLSTDHWNKVFYIVNYYFDDYAIARLNDKGFRLGEVPEHYNSEINFSNYYSENKAVKKLQSRDEILESNKSKDIQKFKSKSEKVSHSILVGMGGLGVLGLAASMVLGDISIFYISAGAFSLGYTLKRTLIDIPALYKKDIKGEVISTKVHPLPEIGSNILETIKAFMSSIDDKVEPSINEKIRVSFAAAEKLHENEYLDAQTRADIDSLITSKLIPSVETYMQANSFAPTAQDSAWVEDTFRDQLKEINIEVERLNEAVFEQRKEQMQIQSMYLTSAQKPGILDLKK